MFVTRVSQEVLDLIICSLELQRLSGSTIYLMSHPCYTTDILFTRPIVLKKLQERYETSEMQTG